MSLDRRTFLQLAGASCTVAALPMRCVAEPGNAVAVTSFGADPSGKADSLPAIRRAIASLPLQNAVLKFAPGTYRLSADGKAAMVFHGFDNVAVLGRGAELIFEKDTQPFAFSDCRGVTVEGFIVDWAQLPFTQGTVTQADKTSFVLRLDEGFTLKGDEQVGAIGTYDRTLRRPAVNGVDSYHSVAGMEPVGAGLMQVNLNSAVPLHAGDTVVMRHSTYKASGLQCTRSSGIVVRDVTFYALPGMAFVCDACHDIELLRFRTVLRPKTNRLLSICVDGVHLTGCSGRIEIADCEFEGMGDDGINICALLFRVEAQGGTRVLSIGLPKGGALAAWRVPQSGTTVEFLDATTQRLLGMGTVASVAQAADSVQVALTQTIPAEVTVGALMGASLDQTEVSIHGSSFRNNRARGVLVHRNARISGNTFSGCSLAGILMAADTTWFEGPLVKNVVIEKNTFRDCYYAHPHDRRGTITLDTAHDRGRLVSPAAVVNSDVVIRENTFGGSPAAAVYAAGVQGLVIEGNHLGRTDTLSGGQDAVVLRRVENVTVRGNDVPEKGFVMALETSGEVAFAHNLHLAWKKSE
jgi:hypothetical protein